MQYATTDFVWIRFNSHFWNSVSVWLFRLDLRNFWFMLCPTWNTTLHISMSDIFAQTRLLCCCLSIGGDESTVHVYAFYDWWIPIPALIPLCSRFIGHSNPAQRLHVVILEEKINHLRLYSELHRLISLWHHQTARATQSSVLPCI